MKAARYHLQEIGILQVDEVPEPAPGVYEIRVRVAFSGICGSDLARYRQLSQPPPALRELLGAISPIPGHEFSGVIDQLGPGTPETWEDGTPVLGAHVVVHPQLACGVCPACLSGYWTGCIDTNRIQLMGLHRDGGFTEYVVAPFDHVIPIPTDRLSLQNAALAEPLAVAIHSVNLAIDNLAGVPDASAPICVIGDGPIGLLTACWLQYRGYQRVTLVGRHPHRLDTGRRMGVGHIQTDGEASAGRQELYSHLFHTAGAQSALELGISLLAQGGQMITVGYLHESDPGIHAELFFQLIRREKSIKGSCGYTFGELTEAVEALAKGSINGEALISAVIALNEIVEKGFEALISGERTPGKVLVQLK
jgi:(R,R)-butanediol dehydrogenase / meso-butanediol dehydrogenase / diacetyl reductase